MTKAAEKGDKWILPDGQVIEWLRTPMVGSPATRDFVTINGQMPSVGDPIPESMRRQLGGLFSALSVVPSDDVKVIKASKGTA